ncbi:MAG: PKD domain-containing protein [Verrucomicrobiota bacterium]
MNRKRVFTISLAILMVAGLALFILRERRTVDSAEVFLENSESVRPKQTISTNFASRAEVETPLARDRSIEKLGSAWGDEIAEPTTAQFYDWSHQYAAASAQAKIALENEGVKLAAKRRVALEKLIQTDPERALENAVPFSVRRELPHRIKELLEERISGRGELAVFGVLPEPGKELEIDPTFRIATIDGKEFKAFTYGRRLGEPTKRNIPLNGIAVGNLLAVNENPVRILEKAEADEVVKTSEAICAVSGDSTTLHQDETAVDIGSEIIFLCRRAHADDLNQQIIAAESGGTSSAGDVEASAYTEGQKKLIAIRVDFPDLVGVPFSDSTGTNLISGLNSFYSDCSYGRASFALVGQGSDYTPTFRMPTNSSYYTNSTRYNNLRTDARTAATAAGYILTNYNFDLICMGSVPGFNWSGLGYVGSPGAWIRNSFGTGVSAHELGHNYGLNHANFWDTYGLSIIGTSGTNIEYGDSFDTMGAASAGNNHFNARYKRYLNWLTTNEITTVTNSGTYRIFCHDNTNSTGVRALNIAKNSSTNYWIEFRQKFTSNRWLMSGAGLRWAQSGNQKSLLLDTTPGSADGKSDAAIIIGRTFSDKPAGIHITPIGKGGTTPESLDVVINKGTFPTNVPPTITIAASATNVASGATVNFTATADDSNGDTLAYYWDFGDKNFGTNGATASKSWSATAEYVVRCTTTDMKGGVASDSVIVRVGSPTSYRISGQVTTNSAPIQGVRVYASSTLMTYTDSDGTYNLVGLPAGTYTLNAQLDGYTLVHPTFSNPISVGPDATGIDFNASTVVPPTITSQPQSRAVAAGTNVTFSVTATGDTPVYRWQFNGAVMANKTNATLTLTNVQLTNAGFYSVIVSNVAGTVTSSNAALTVNVPPTIAAISNQTVSENALLSFTVTASDPTAATTNLFADFESFQNGAASIMFRAPNYSPTTATNLDASPNLTAITTNPPAGIQNNRAALNVNWSFKTGVVNPWLRLTSSSAPSLANPTVHFSHTLRFQIFSDKALKVGVGLRETGTSAAIGTDGGTVGVIEYVGVSNVVNGTPLPIRSIAPNIWTTVEINLPTEPVAAFTGNGILESASGKGVLEHLCFAPDASAGAYNIYLDNFADLDAGTLSFSLEPGAPAGASIDPQTGVFSWIPTEAQGPGIYPIAVCVTDNGVPALSATNLFSVTVTETNNAPVLTAISNKFVNAGAALVFTNSASDSDLPANILSFTFGSNELAGATIDSSSGIFNWVAPDSEIFLTNNVSIVVTDNGVPSLNDTKDFVIVVVPPPRVSGMVLAPDGSLTLTWQTFPGKTYQVQYKNNLEQTDWTDYEREIIAEGESLSATDNFGAGQPQRFYRILQLD